MGKWRSGILVLAFFLVMLFDVDSTFVHADNETVPEVDNQVVNDEGYGKDDTEYYNSEDDNVNDQGSSAAQGTNKAS